MSGKCYSQDYSDSLTWTPNSIFIASGYGSPQGLRTELGYNFATLLSIGLTYNIHDNWSRDPVESKYGVFLKLTFPIPSLRFSPYVFYNYGTNFEIFGGPDSYNLIYLGAMIPIITKIYLRPELGFCFTSKHVSGGSSPLGGDTKEIKDKNKTFGINLSLELDF